ncbi:MAG: hypothetical protein Q8N81_08115 [bacterium]|nr:hypothetical protein [bacterium]
MTPENRLRDGKEFAWRRVSVTAPPDSCITVDGGELFRILTGLRWFDEKYNLPGDLCIVNGGILGYSALREPGNPNLGYRSAISIDQRDLSDRINKWRMGILRQLGVEPPLSRKEKIDHLLEKAGSLLAFLNPDRLAYLLVWQPVDNFPKMDEKRTRRYLRQVDQVMVGRPEGEKKAHIKEAVGRLARWKLADRAATLLAHEYGGHDRPSLVGGLMETGAAILAGATAANLLILTGRDPAANWFLVCVAARVGERWMAEQRAYLAGRDFPEFIPAICVDKNIFSATAGS